jgi:hippurate hydrolase
MLLHARLACAAALAAAPLPLLAKDGASRAAKVALSRLDAIYADLEALYLDLHRNPELSLQEEKTAAKLAARLRSLGFEVTEKVGGHGVVGVLGNGKGPTVLLRTDMDALPILEETGLPHASTVTATDQSGKAVPVMHACGHDVHMASWTGAATLLARSKDQWRGTLVMVAQPAEELVRGAAAMIAEGLFTRFPRPDFAVAIHQTPLLPAGQVGVVPGYAMAHVNGVEVAVHGQGGHGATPHLTVDPVLLASRIVVSLQGIVAREVNPLDPAVVTVGSIHGGTKGNVIPDEVKLQLTVRSFKEEVQQQLLSAIARVARGEAAASGAPREPTVVVAPGAARSLYNDPALAARLRSSLERALGAERVKDYPPIMGSEDFSEFGRAGVPSSLFWVGSADPAVFAEARSRGAYPPGNHTARMTPDRDRTLRTGVSTLTASALALLAAP